MNTGRRLLPVAGGRETARTTWAVIRRRPRPLVATVAAYVGVGALGLVAPWALGAVVDVVIDGGPAERIVVLAVVIAIAAVGGGLLTTAAAAALARVAAPAVATLREDVLDRAVHLDSGRLEEAGAGDVMSRVGDDVRTVTTALDDTVPTVLAAFVTTGATAFGLLALDWRLGFAGLAASPCYALALRWYLRRSSPLYRQERIAEGERAEALVTGLQGATTLRAFGREQRHLRRIVQRSEDAVDVSTRVWSVLLRWGNGNNASEFVGLALVTTAGFLMVRSGAGTVGEATAAALYFHRLFNPIGALLYSFDAVQSVGAALARMVGVLAMPRDDRPHAVVERGAVVRLEGVGHAYSPGRPVLRGIDLEVAPGEHVALVGATGAGKTTLGAVLAGRVRPTAGRVLVGDVDLAEHDERTARTHIRHVSQELHVFAGSVADNLTLARADAGPAALRDVLERVGAWGWVEALPDGLATVVGEHGTPLDPVQTQALALARVLLADPPVVVLDEATAEAGSAGARALEDAAAVALAGRAAVVIAHRLSQAARCDRVVVLDAGRAVETGTHSDLVAAGGRYAELWRSWAG